MLAAASVAIMAIEIRDGSGMAVPESVAVALAEVLPKRARQAV